MNKKQGAKNGATSVSIVKPALFALLATIAVYIYMHRAPGRLANQDVIDQRTHSGTDPWNKHAVDSAISLLQTGDLVLRNGIDATSDLLRQMNQTDKTYSHCGLVVVEHGYPFVYHSIGGEDNPNDCMRRDSASIFFSPYNNLNFGIVRYDMDSTAKNKMKEIIWTYYKQKVKFDMDFDLKTDDRLYCAEFVYKTLNKATGDSTYIKPTHVMGYTFAGTDDLFVNRHAHLVWQVKFK